MNGWRPDEPPDEPREEPLDDLLHEGVPRDPAYELDAVVEAARAAEARDGRSHGWRALLLVASLTIATAGTVAALRPGWLPFDVPFREELREEERPVGPSGPALRRDTPLRAAPREDGAVLVQLPAGTRLRLVGKSADGRWIAAAAEDRPGLVGWVTEAAVEGVDPAALATVTADPRAATPPAAPTGPVARPDLLIESVYAKDNRLSVSVLNAGPADARGTLLASVDGGPAVPLEGKSDEGLRAGQRIQAAVVGGFVQIRSTVTVTVSLSPSVPEVDQANNTFTGIVEPDQPVDLEIAGVERGASALVVTIRNNSTIPVAGVHTITVREPLPGTRLLGRTEQSGTIEAGGSMVFFLSELRDADLTAISITLSSDSIADGTLGNNTYPR